MKKIFLFLACFLLVTPTFAEDDLQTLIDNHIFYTYSEDEINDNLYTIHSYWPYDGPYEDYPTQFTHNHRGAAVALYVWDGKFVTTKKAIGWEPEYKPWFHIICKQMIDDYLYEDCLWTAKFLYQHTQKGLFLFQVDSIKWKDLKNTEDKTSYDDNWFVTYGERYADYSKLTPSSNYFKNTAVLSENTNNSISVESGNFTFPGFIFYNNSFFGIDNFGSFISKNDILDFLNKKGNISYYTPDSQLLSDFEAEADEHIVDSESYKQKMEVSHISAGLKTSSLYQNIYSIANFEDILRWEWVEWIYAVYYGSQDENRKEIINFDIESHLNSRAYSFPQEFTNTEELWKAKIKPITSGDFTISASDIFDSVESKNTFYRLKVYLKKDGVYYGNPYYYDGYFVLNPVWKGKEIVSLISQYNQKNIDDKKITQILNKIFLWKKGDSATKLQKNIETRLQKLLDETYISLDPLFKKISSEADFKKQEVHTLPYVYKIQLIEKVKSKLSNLNTQTGKIEDPFEEIDIFIQSIN